MYPVQGSLVIDGGMIVIVQALISQLASSPGPLIKARVWYTLSVHAQKLLGSVSNLVCFSLVLFGFPQTL